MAVQDVLRLDRVIRKEAIGRFEHGAIATGLGQGGGGVLGQDASEFDQALRYAARRPVRHRQIR